MRMYKEHFVPDYCIESFTDYKKQPSNISRGWIYYLISNLGITLKSEHKVRIEYIVDDNELKCGDVKKSNALPI